ncbi:MAG TPA: type VI secretion system baseplate subunit TssE [Terrimicrobiaceae bacterium]
MTTSEQILPGLLDRLSNDSSYGTEGRSFSATTIRQYHQSVIRDLHWLLNARSTLSEEAKSEFPEVARSVLNFGTRDFSGMAVSSVDSREIERELLEAVQHFEPRILRRTLSVKAVSPSERGGLNVVAFEIRAEVWAVPFPEQVYIRTLLDLETGQYQVQ